MYKVINNRRYNTISIHALREEGDQLRKSSRSGWKKFLSTPSARRATGADQRPQRQHCISIHALREEGDIIFGWGNYGNGHFYPRPPRGGRRHRHT